MSFYENGPVRIRYEEGRLRLPAARHRVAGDSTRRSPVWPRIPSTRWRSSRERTASSRRTCATPTAASLPVRSEIDRPLGCAYRPDHLGVMDHLGIDRFMGARLLHRRPLHLEPCLRRAPDRVVAAVLTQPSAWSAEHPTLFYDNNMRGLGPGARRAPARDHDGHGRQVPDHDVPLQCGFRVPP